MKKVRKLVIPVAGMGTRFLPVTKSIPKEMFPIIDVPTIQILLEEAKTAGIEQVIFITNDKKQSIVDYFEYDQRLEDKLVKNNKLSLLEKVKEINNGLEILTLKQVEPLGSGDAVLKARNLIGNEPFAVMYGDDIIKGGCALKELIDIYEKYNSNVIGVQQVPHEITYKYGIVYLKNKVTLEINGIVEKPNVEDAPSDLAGLGRYIFKPEIFEVLKHLKIGYNGEYQITDAITELMKKDSFYACKFSGTYYDLGCQIGYLKANIAYAMDRPELKNSLIKFMKEKINEYEK